MRKAIASVTLAAMLAGCSHVHPSDPTSAGDAVDEVNRGVSGRTVDITLMDATELWAEGVRVTADSTWLTVVGQPSYARTWRGKAGRGLPTSEIRAISIRRHGRGAIEGAVYGFLWGFAAGATLGTRDPWVPVAGGGAVIGGIGFVTGLLYGAIAGSKDVYDFTEAPSAPSQRRKRR
jgi:hypothetical protein